MFDGSMFELRRWPGSPRFHLLKLHWIRAKKDTIHARKPHLIHYFLAILNLINQYKSSSIQSSSKKSFQVYPCHAKWIYLRLAFRSGMAEAISKTIASIEATTTTDFREFQSCWFMKLTNNFMLIKILRVYNLEYYGRMRLYRDIIWKP